MDLEFFRGKKVLITGHSGFKGSWLSYILYKAGAKVTGCSLLPEKDVDALYNVIDLGNLIDSRHVDIRNYEALQSVFDEVKPELVFHLAAQPIVRESYVNPVYTYETNVIGTVNILECVRHCDSVKSFLNVTTDKVYLNKEWAWGYRENEELDGFDPYSNSKSCSELVTHSYKSSFFTGKNGECLIPISTARAGNVIGGGDFAADRIIPDCVRAAVAGKDIIVRNPFSTRPYQHVLEPLYAYMMIVEEQYKDNSVASWYNVGPDDRDCFRTGDLVDTFVECWGDGLKWVNKHDGGPHEANFLKLDCSKLKSVFGWKPYWDLKTAISYSVDWYKCWAEHGDILSLMDRQISDFFDR